MCIINNGSKRNYTVVGYKMAIQDKYGHCYSPVTG